jgi:hypothetical protein
MNDLKISQIALAFLGPEGQASPAITPEEYALAAHILRDFAEVSAVALPKLQPAQNVRNRHEAIAAWKLARFLHARAHWLFNRRIRGDQ